MVIPTNTYSSTVEEILGLFLRENGDKDLTAEEAQVLFGGSEAAKVKDLSMNELMQVVIIEAYAVIEQMVQEKQTTPNRATRRAK